MTVQEFQARRVEGIGRALAHFTATTAEEKLDWHPSVTNGASARSVYDQVAECIQVNRYFAATLRGETVSPPQSGEAAIVFESTQEAQRRLIESADELAAAIRALPDESLTAAYTVRRGEVTGEKLLEMGYRNMAYHAGQVNYIQVLAGDTAFHVPATWI